VDQSIHWGPGCTQAGFSRGFLVVGL
jgi:hypothetical protein